MKLVEIARFRFLSEHFRNSPVSSYSVLFLRLIRKLTHFNLMITLSQQPGDRQLNRDDYFLICDSLDRLRSCV